MTRKLFCTSAVLFILFAALAAAVSLVDVQAIGPLDSEVGLATLNGSVRDLIGESALLYEISEITGLIAIAAAVGFAALGGYQLIKRKNPLKVDADIIALGVFYVIVVCVYLFFEIFVVNCRPVLTDGALEASFPSSHTVLAASIFGTSIYQFVKRLKGVWRIASASVSGALLCATVIFRLLSGVHWFTDIIGGLLIGGALICAYIGACTVIKKDA